MNNSGMFARWAKFSVDNSDQTRRRSSRVASGSESAATSNSLNNLSCTKLYLLDCTIGTLVSLWPAQNLSLRANGCMGYSFCDRPTGNTHSLILFCSKPYSNHKQ